jgi:N-acetylmuramoyl-L-alanine amidase
MATKICIDAGHYGKYNRSPVVPAYYESEMNWKLHLLLKKELEGYGFEVITTRADQAKDLALEARGKASKGCDLFLSLHSNAADSEAVNYVVAMHQVDDNCGPMDEESRTVAKLLADCVAGLMGGKPETWSTQSSADRDGNGYKDDYYGVLRGAHSVGTTGVIIEHGFHTNAAQATWLLDDKNLQRLAVAEAATIAEWFDVEKVPEAPAVLYRVQVGAYTVKKNAEAQMAKVKAAGFDAFIVQVDGKLYRVQVGAYSVKANAEAQMAKVKAAGFSAFVTKNGGQAVEPEPAPTTKKEEYTMTMRTMQKGDKGEDVKALQILLNGRGYDCGNVDGIFGSKTEAQVIKYQGDKDLEQDGKAGPITMGSLLGV